MALAKNITSNVFIKIIKIILEFIISVIILRGLGLENQGYVAYLLLVFGLMASYSNFGITNATTYYQTRSNFSAESVFSTNISYLTILSFVITIIVYLFKGINKLLVEYDIFLIFMGNMYMWSLSVSTCIQLFYIGKEEIVKSNKYLLITNIVKFILIVKLFILNILNVHTYITIYVITAFLNTVLLFKNIEYKYYFKINKSLLIKEFKYGIVIYLASLFSYLNYYIDQFFIKKFCIISELGIYSIAVMISSTIMLIPTSISGPLAGKLYNISVDSDQRNIITSKTVKYTFYFCLLIFVVFTFSSPIIPVIYGGEFSDRINVFIILVLSVAFSAIGSVSYPYFTTKGKPGMYLIITSISISINILCNIIMIPQYGILGAAIASLISYFAYGVAHIIVFIWKEGFVLKEIFWFDNTDLILVNNSIRKLKNRLRRSN